MDKKKDKTVGQLEVFIGLLVSVLIAIGVYKIIDLGALNWANSLGITEFDFWLIGVFLLIGISVFVLRNQYEISITNRPKPRIKPKKK